MSTLARPVNAASPSLSERLDELQHRIAQAARRSGREPGQVLLIGAVKTVPIEQIREAVALGLTDLGENRVQEAVEAFDAIGRAVRWHMIGNLQRNKAARAAGIFDRIHGIDGIEIARALSRHAAVAGRVTGVMVQVNVSGEENKHGVDPEAVPALLEAVAGLEALALDGLMSIGAAVESAEDARRYFAATRELRDRCERSTGLALPHLSMGMSGDFEVAIEEGSTMVRVGTALFGSRH
jgi:pyridoxal phosphate enzyme (YggS family)